MKAYIVTGTSRGLGEAIVKQLLEGEVTIFCLSRTVNNDLIDLAIQKNKDLDYITYDLNDIHGIKEIMDEIMNELEEESLDGIYLINNAGILQPIKPIEKCGYDELSLSMHVNLIAPMTLTSVFIEHTKDWKGCKRILNISSGAGRHGIYGWSAYCAAKAGLDRFTEAVGIEQKTRNHPVEILSLAPGIIDTPMQEEIRSTDEADFVELDRFVGFKENGDLRHPEMVAKDIIDLLEGDQYEQGGITDLRSL